MCKCRWKWPRFCSTKNAPKSPRSNCASASPCCWRRTSNWKHRTTNSNASSTTIHVWRICPSATAWPKSLSRKPPFCVARRTSVRARKRWCAASRPKALPPRQPRRSRPRKPRVPCRRHQASHRPRQRLLRLVLASSVGYARFLQATARRTRPHPRQLLPQPRLQSARQALRTRLGVAAITATTADVAATATVRAKVPRAALNARRAKPEHKATTVAKVPAARAQAKLQAAKPDARTVPNVGSVADARPAHNAQVRSRQHRRPPPMPSPRLRTRNQASQAVSRPHRAASARNVARAMAANRALRSRLQQRRKPGKASA